MPIRAAIDSVVELVNPSGGLGMLSASASASKAGLQSSKEDLVSPPPLKKHAYTCMSNQTKSKFF